MRVIIVALSLLGVVLSSPLSAEELTSEKKEAIQELLQVTGASEMGVMLGNAFSSQMVDAVKNSKPDIDPKVFTILQEEIDSLMHEELVEKQALLTEMYPIYNKYLTLAELKELTAFYKSPVGQKAITVLPQMSRESMRVGQVWGQDFSEMLHKRFTERLAKEGLSLEEE